MKAPGESSRHALARTILALALALLGAEAPANEVDVIVHEGQIDVSARAAPLSQVLDQLAAAIGAEVQYEGPPPPQLVTLAFVDLTPAEVLLSVLRGQGIDFALQMDAAGGKVVRLLVAADSPVADQSRLPPPTDLPLEAPTSPPPAMLEQLLHQMGANVEEIEALVDEAEADRDEAIQERDAETPEPPALPEVLRRFLEHGEADGKDPGEPGDTETSAAPPLRPPAQRE